MPEIPASQPPASPPKKRRWLRRIFALVLGFCLMGGAALYWLASTEGGLRATLALAETLSGQRLRVSGISGTLAETFTLKEVVWQGADRVRLQDLVLHWSPMQGRHGLLDIVELRAARLDLALAPSPDSPPPDQFTLPFALRLAHLELGALYLDDATAPVLENLVLRGESDGRLHTLQTLRLAAPGFFTLKASGQWQGDGALPLRAQAEIRGRVAGRDTRLVLSADGPLARLPLSGQLATGRNEGGTGSLSLTLSPFAAQPVEQVRVHLEGMDPAFWHPAAPRASLFLDADLATDFSPGAPPRLRGKLTLENRAVAPLNQNGLPLATLTAEGQWYAQDPATVCANATAAATDRLALTAEFPGKGRYQGKLSLLCAKTTPGLQMEGTLARLNPRHFSAAWPEGNLNGRFSAQTLLPTADAARRDTLEFQLAPSRLAGRAVSGKGSLRHAAERLEAVTLALAAGNNRITASGALGKRDDRLRLEIALPELATLALPELSGDLAARLLLSGALTRPALEGEIKSQRLAFGAFRLRDLILSGKTGALDFSAPREPLEARLALAALEHPALRLADAALELSGTPGAHQLTLRANPHLPEFGTTRFALDASGGIDKGLWRGSLKTLSLTQSARSAPLLTLAAPAGLTLDATRFALKNAVLRGQLHGGNWQAELPELTREGDIWQGRLAARTPDLAWVAPLLGEDYQSGGEATLDLAFARLAPAWFDWALGHAPPPRVFPQLEGTLTGKRLLFRALAPGLRLEDGSIVAHVDAHRLTLKTFHFDAPHSAVSSRLTREWREPLERLATASGKVEGSGHLNFGASDAPGELRLRLERLGVLQKPDQWIVLSGEGTLRREQTPRRLETRLEAKLGVDGGYWQLADMGAPQLSADVRVIRKGDAPAAATDVPPVKTNTVARIAVNLGSNFYFAGAGVRTRLRGALELAGDERAPLRATGSIRTVGGQFDAYGQKLEIEQGILTFNGLVQNPGLNIRAFRTHQAVEAGVAVTGTARKPVIKLVSRPDVPDTEKLSWLVLGEAPEQNSGADNAALLVAANALLSGDGSSGPGSALAEIQRRLGVQVSLGHGQVGRDNSPARTSQVADSTGFDERGGTASSQILRVGMQLATGLTLSYEQSMDGVESVVKLSYALTRQLSLTGQTGSDNALDLNWNHRFGRKRPAAPPTTPVKTRN
ncbi:MAG: translocation/assembly module TamB domain-containing protein [Zoogloeaceae bacterium]|nr:translocation/assembly module TamB domain-containing protein [Zoogloeaceae bacterium]